MPHISEHHSDTARSNTPRRNTARGNISSRSRSNTTRGNISSRTRTRTRSRTGTRGRSGIRIHNRRAPRRIAAVLAAAGIAVTLTASLSGCGALDKVAELGNPVGRGLFDNAASFERSAAAKTVPSGWVPDDASGVRVTYRNDGSAALITFTSGQALDALCSPANTVPTPALEDSWWPQTLPGSAYLCGDRWTAFADGSTVYAFTGTSTTTTTTTTTTTSTTTSIATQTDPAPAR